MGETFIPHLSGGIFLALLMEATLPRVSARAHREGKSDPVTDQNTLEALFKIVKPSFIAPKTATKKDSWKAIVNKYKSCQQSDGTDITILNSTNISDFKKRVSRSYSEVFSEMVAFTQDFLDPDQSRRQLLIARLRALIRFDIDIQNDAEFVMPKRKVRKNEFLELSPISFEECLLAIWHYVVCENQNNTVGSATYAEWWKAADNDKRTRGGGKRKYMGPLPLIDDCTDLPVLRKSKGFIDITKTSNYHNNESDENTEDIETKLLAQTSWSSGEVKEVVDYLLAVIIRIAGKGIPADKTSKFIGRVSESFKGVFWGSHYDEVDYRRVISAMRSPIPQDLVVTLTTISHESLNVPSIGMEREESQSKELQRLQKSFSETFARRYVEAIDFSHRELIQEFCDTVCRVLSSSRNAIKQIFKDYGVCIYDADRLLPVANSLMKKLKSVAQDRLQIEMTDGLSSHSSLDRYLEKLQKRYERARIYQYSDFPFEAFYIPPRLIPLELKSAPVKGMVKSEVKTGSPYGHTVSFDKPLIGGINSVVLEEALKSIEQRHKTRRNHGYVELQLSSGRNALLQIMRRFGVTEEEISDIAPLVEEEGTIAWTTIFSKPGIKCLMGGAGYGKSLFLQNIVLNYSQLDGVYDTSRYLVVFCDLKAILKAGEQTPVVEFMQHEMLKATGENLPLEFIQQFIDNGRCIVLLDAVDEIPSEHREEVMKMLMAFWESENPGNKVCITSRSKDYIPLNERCEVFEISELWRHHIVDYIRKLVALDIFNDEDCADFVNQAGHLIDNGFLRSFLILSLLVGIYKGEKTLPSTKLELYDKCVKYVSFNREKGRGERNAEQKSLSFNWKDLDLLMTDDIFATLATLCKPNNSEVSRNQILSALQDSVAYDCGSRREAISAINEFLRFCTERTELFVLGNYPERYRFFHRSFYEYFCAINIAERCSDNGDILTELKSFDGDSEVFELFCANLMQTNKNKLRSFIEFLLGEIEGGLRNDALDYQLFAVFNLLLRWQQSIGTKTKFFDILCENSEAVATVVSHIDFADYISEALGGIEISKTDKANFQIKFKEYAIIDVLNNVCRWSIDNPNDKNTATINRYAFFTELYALYCGYQSTGDFVRDLLCDTNVRTQIKSGQSFSNSEKKRIQSNIEKLKVYRIR